RRDEGGHAPDPDPLAPGRPLASLDLAPDARQRLLARRADQAILDGGTQPAHDAASGTVTCRPTIDSASEIRRLAVASEQPQCDATSVSSSPSTWRSIQ